MPHEITIKRSKTDKSPLVLEYDFGTDIADAISKFDGPTPLDNVVHTLFVVGAKQQLAEYVRKLLAAHKGAVPLGAKGVQAKLESWKPAIKHRGKPPVEKAMETISDMSSDERAELLRRLQSYDPGAAPVANGGGHGHGKVGGAEESVSAAAGK